MKSRLLMLAALLVGLMSGAINWWVAGVVERTAGGVGLFILMVALVVLNFYDAILSFRRLEKKRAANRAAARPECP